MLQMEINQVNLVCCDPIFNSLKEAMNDNEPSLIRCCDVVKSESRVPTHIKVFASALQIVVPTPKKYFFPFYCCIYQVINYKIKSVFFVKK